MNSIIIRKAGTEDVQQPAALSATTFYEAFAKDNTPENMQKHLQEYYSIEKLSDELHDGLVTFLLAYADDELAGYVKISEHVSRDENHHLEEPIELERIYALQKMIGKGIGSALMQATIAFATVKQKKTLWLVVFQQNSVAIAFYKKWGFEIYGEHVFVAGDDPQTDWVMKKSLSFE
ncbi:MAG: GNAT family N-acetyltransferase [Chitinophagaceae bacterium]|nr:GNAT family N-acetyltransferase [Chitinophagaceae bacterium]